MLNMQNVKDIDITEGSVRTIHDKDNKLIWGRLAYDTKYAGNTIQNGAPTPTNPINVDVVTGTQTVTIVASYGLYQGSTYTLNLAGDNLFDVSKVINNSPSLINNGDGTLTVTAYGTQGTAPNTLSAYCPTLQVGDEVILSADTTSTNKFVYLAGTNTQWKFGDKRKILASDLTSRVLWYSDNASTPATISNIKIVKPIELCKIGDYQDYIYKSGDDWYVHKECGHIQLDANIYGILQDGTAGVNEVSYAGAFYVLKGSWNTAGGDYDNDAANARLSSNFGEYREQTISGNGVANSMVDGTFCQRSTNDRVYMRFSTLAGKTGNEVKTILQEQGGTNFYYYLNTPSDTQITDSTLISQLDAIDQFLTRYGYNSNVVGNLPIIINKTNL